MTDHLRVSDAERREASELLSRHFMDGRLDHLELDERVGEAMRARTRGDLRRLLVDLPPLAVVPSPSPVSARRPRRGARRLAALAVALSLLVPASLLARVHASHAVTWSRRPAAAVLLPFLRTHRRQELFVPGLGARAVSIVAQPAAHR